MNRSMAIVVAALAGSFSVASHAQSQTAYGPDTGFFRPAPDVSLTAPRTPNGSTPQAAQQPFLTITSPQAMPAPAMPVAVPATVSVVPAPAINRGMNAAIANPAAATATVVSPGNAATSAAPVPVPPAVAQTWAEQQMDRSENAAERARVQMQTTPPGVGAAFDGTTSVENR